MYCTFKLRCEKAQFEYKDVRRNYDPERFKAELSELPFFEIYGIHDVN